MIWRCLLGLLLDLVLGRREPLEYRPEWLQPGSPAPGFGHDGPGDRAS